MSMVPKTAAAKITDFETSFDAVPEASADGLIFWADVRITYRQSGLAPVMTIRVPVPWDERDTAELRKSKALRCARQLIDHACRAGAVAEEQETRNPAADMRDVMMPALEGLAQELGLAEPTRRPRQRVSG